jgi:hypothetical protein
MKWGDIRFNPMTRELRQFAGLLAAFCGAVTAWAYWRGWSAGWVALFAAAVIVGLIGLAFPRPLRPLYVGWMVAAFPIGWAVSNVVLGIVFVTVFVPTGLIFRLFGRDALRLRKPAPGSHWTQQAAINDLGRYLRQY